MITLLMAYLVASRLARDLPAVVTLVRRKLKRQPAKRLRKTNGGK